MEPEWVSGTESQSVFQQNPITELTITKKMAACNFTSMHCEHQD